MDFDFTSEQLMLRDMTRELLASESSAAAVRQIMQTPEGFSRSTWAKLAELGLLGLAVPERLGGQGLGPIEQSLVLEEMGRAALPSPYFASSVLAATALLAAGDERYLAGIASGETIATLAWLEQPVSWRADAIGVEARRQGSGWSLHGTKWLVPFAHVADLLLVAARADAGLTLFAVERGAPGLEVKPLNTMDLTNRVSQVRFDGAPAQVIGEPGLGGQLLEHVLQRAALYASAEMLGAARRCLDMAVEYAKTREQFGQPIGSFQAIKHKCADMAVLVEQSHAVTYYAAWALSAGVEDGGLSASAAKAYVSDAARKVCGDAIQVHGGIGFTWDYDLHLYFKRAKHLEPLYGDAAFHRERVLAAALDAER